MKVNSSCYVVASTNWLILCRGKLSFGQDLIKLVKSMHVCHLPFGFFMSTGFVSQSGYNDSLMKLLALSFAISSFRATYLSASKALYFCQTDFSQGLCLVDDGLS